MTKTITAFSIGVLLLSAVVGGIYLQHKSALARSVAQARTAVGGKNGATVLEGLGQEYPKCAEIQFLRARQLRMELQSERALAALNRAHDLGWPQLDIERESLLVRAQTDFTQAEPLLMARLNAEPEDQDLLAALATGWSRQKEVKRAESLLNSLLERDPDDAFARYLLGKLRLIEGKPHQARADLEKALQSGAGRYYEPDARLALANCLLDISQFDEALQTYRQCQVDVPENREVLLGIGRCYWHLGRWPEAEESFQALLQLDPDHADALSQLAYIYEERGELQRAVELLERAVKVDPKWYDLHFRIAKILLALGQKDRAAEHQERAEIMKRHWAKPRDRNVIGANPYTGEESHSLGQDAHH